MSKQEGQLVIPDNIQPVPTPDPNSAGTLQPAAMALQTAHQQDTATPIPWWRNTRTLKGQFTLLAVLNMFVALILVPISSLSFFLVTIEPAMLSQTNSTVLVSSFCIAFCVLLAATALRMALVTHRIINAGLTLALAIAVIFGLTLISRLSSLASTTSISGQMPFILLSVLIFPLAGLSALWGIVSRFKDF